MDVQVIIRYAFHNKMFLKRGFRCPGAIDTFEWVMMSFSLKNALATYQRAMNLIFHELIGTFMQAYIDDVVVKSTSTGL